MRSIRIYKDDIRVHVLRSLFFTDTILVVSGAVVIALFWFFIFHYVIHFFSWGYFISLLIVSEIFFLGFITQKVDNQAIYKIAPRGVTFQTGKKEFRQNQMESYFLDFQVQDNLIIRKGSIVRIYEVEPYDIALLNDQDRENFFVKLKQMIHVMPSQVQFIVRKEKTKVKDYSTHFFSIYNKSQDIREPLINRYIEDLTKLIETHEFMTVHHYAVFSVSCDTAKPHERVKAIKKLNDVGIRFASAMSACNINVTPLSNDELISFCKETLR